MAAKRPLKVVPPDARRSPSVREAADESGLALLVALRNKVAGDIDKGVPAHALASLVRQLRELDREIRTIRSGEDGDEVGSAAEAPDEEWVTS